MSQVGYSLKAAPRKQLTLFDSTCLIVGIIIGAGVYETSPKIAAAATHSWQIFAFWLIGGLLSLCGALCYAELATMLPCAGGDYVYLSRAYGRWAGFLFGWVQMIIVRPGDIALVAFVFATYARPLAANTTTNDVPVRLILACLAVLVLTAINILGVREGKWTQNVLTIAKVVGLVAIMIVSAFVTGTVEIQEQQPTAMTPFGLALILVLFTFGGWNEMAYVAAEVRSPERNIVRSLLVGTVVVTLCYLLLNAAFLGVLGHARMANSNAVATDTVRALWPDWGGRLVSGLVCVSALGAVNGLIFTGARISYAIGQNHAGFRPLGQWHPRIQTPVRALILQAVLAMSVILISESFDVAILYTSSAVYMFYLATTLSVIVLRLREPELPRPFRVVAFPVVPIIFSVVCVYLIWSALNYNPKAGLTSFAILLLGIPVFAISKRYAQSHDNNDHQNHDRAPEEKNA